jgi:hypothetical protein
MVLALALSVAVATWRYPDSETIRISRDGSFPPGCVPLDEESCVFVYTDNVWGRIYTIGAGALIAGAAFAAAFRRSLDRPRGDQRPAA